MNLSMKEARHKQEYSAIKCAKAQERQSARKQIFDCLDVGS